MHGHETWCCILQPLERKVMNFQLKLVEKLGFASWSYRSYMTVVEVDTEVSRVAESDSDVCFLSHLKNTSHWQVSYLGEESHNVHNVFKGEKNFLSSPNVIVLWHTYSLAPTPTPTSSQAKGNPGSFWRVCFWLTFSPGGAPQKNWTAAALAFCSAKTKHVVAPTELS